MMVQRWMPTIYRLLLCAVAGLAIALAAVSSSRAAEIRLRPQCMASGPLVKLGDVADIVTADKRQADALAAIELFPAPAAPQQRFLRVRELQDLLLLRGVNLAEHQFSGSSQVSVSAGVPATTRPAAGQAPSISAVRRASRRVCEAVAKHLQEKASADQPWVVDAELNEQQARLFADAAATISITGGQPPWTGTQHFEVAVRSAQGVAHFPLDARVTVPGVVVVTVRALQRGTVIRLGDVEMQRETPGSEDTGAFHTPEEVIGRETTKAIAAGRPLTPDALRAPLLVHRGDVVTVYVHSAGIRIRTTARCRDDGSQGDLVAVESLLDRSTFFAQVSGVREVEVYGRSARAEQAAAPAGIVRR
jgi:flagella basal body P-ring formation protein FlgA